MIELDLEGDKYFTDAQVDKLLQTAIRQRVSLEDEMKAARLSRGTPTADQQAFIDRVDAHIGECIIKAQKLREDSAVIFARVDAERQAREAEEAAMVEAAQQAALDAMAMDGGLV